MKYNSPIPGTVLTNPRGRMSTVLPTTLPAPRGCQSPTGLYGIGEAVGRSIFKGTTTIGSMAWMLAVIQTQARFYIPPKLDLFHFHCHSGNWSQSSPALLRWTKWTSILNQGSQAVILSRARQTLAHGTSSPKKASPVLCHKTQQVCSLRDCEGWTFRREVRMRSEQSDGMQVGYSRNSIAKPTRPVVNRLRFRT